MKNLIILIGFCFLIASCNKTEPDVFQENFANTTPISILGLDDLQVGDEFRYELFLGENYWDNDNLNYELKPDTLVLEVCGISTEGKYVISEQFTDNSAMLNSEEFYYPYNNADSVFTNYWVIENDTLKLEEKNHDGVISHLFLFSTPDLDLQEFTENETEIFGWKVIEPAGEFSENYFVTNGEIGQNVYPHINVTIDNYAMAADGPGFMYLYNKEDGILRTSTYSAWTGQAVGWERIVE